MRIGKTNHVSFIRRSRSGDAGVSDLDRLSPAMIAVRCTIANRADDTSQHQPVKAVTKYGQFRGEAMRTAGEQLSCAARSRMI